MIYAQPHKAYGLRRKDRRAIETDPLQFSKVFYYAGQVLNVRAYSGFCLCACEPR